MIVLTPEEELRVLEDYSRIAWAFVHRFSDGRGSSLFTQEDLHQECMLVFVRHMAKCERKEELMRFNPMDFINAMTRYVLKNQAVRLDPNRTANFASTISRVPQTLPLDDVQYVANRQTDPIEEIIERVTLEQFVSQPNIRELERDAIRAMSAGCKVKEAAKRLGKSHQVISYALHTAKKKYSDFVA